HVTGVQTCALPIFWSSRLAFILAATGSAVGLGNVWKFPYVTGENGGGAFVLVYLLCIAIIGIPIMMAEVFIGRNGRHNPITSFRLVAERNLASPGWRLSAIVGMLAAFIILSFYSVIRSEEHTSELQSREN